MQRIIPVRDCLLLDYNSPISNVTFLIVHHLRNKVKRSHRYLSHLSVLPVHYSTVSCTNSYTTCLHVQDHSFRYSQFSSLFLRFRYCKHSFLLTIVRPLQLVVQSSSFFNGETIHRRTETITNTIRKQYRPSYLDYREQN